VTRAANLFASEPGTEGVVAVLCPTLPVIPVVLLGAQVVGVASAINYLLSVDAIAELLVTQRATALIVPGLDCDAAIAEKVQPILERVPGLEIVLHIGDLAPAKSSQSYLSALQPHTGGARNMKRVTRDERLADLRLFSGGRPAVQSLSVDARQPDPYDWSFAQVTVR
jgi:hypothetical protein